MTAKQLWILVALLVVTPYVILGGVGIVWLLEHGWGLQWLALAATLGIAASWLVRTARRKTNPRIVEHIGPASSWPPAGRTAWQQIEQLSDRYRSGELELNAPESLVPLGEQILQIAAKQFHPHSARPTWEVPLTHVALVIELAARDLKQILQEKLPGSHLLTLHDLRRIQEWAAWFPAVSRIYRGVMFLANPASGVAREISSFAQGQLWDLSSEEFKRWLIQLAVRKMGYYAIELYSGHLLLSDLSSGELASEVTQQDQRESRQRDARQSRDPVRVLVVGQVKAGKSSLINALFGEVRSAVDTVPRTRHVEPFEWDKDGEWRGIVLDTAGYAGGDHATVLQELIPAVRAVDLIIWVCSAMNAARDPDRQLLNDLRREFQSQPDRELPAVVVAVTHIDQLRPIREWTPPYDLRQSDHDKVRNIRAAVEQVAQDLQVPVEHIVPVCLAPEEVYNIHEGLLPVVHQLLPAARRLQWQRLLREYHDRETWERLWQQAREAGRFLWSLGRGDVPPSKP